MAVNFGNVGMFLFAGALATFGVHRIIKNYLNATDKKVQLIAMKAQEDAENERLLRESKKRVYDELKIGNFSEEIVAQLHSKEVYEMSALELAHQLRIYASFGRGTAINELRYRKVPISPDLTEKQKLHHHLTRLIETVDCTDAGLPYGDLSEVRRCYQIKLRLSGTAQSIEDLQYQLEQVLKDTPLPGMSVAIVHRNGLPGWVKLMWPVIRLQLPRRSFVLDRSSRIKIVDFLIFLWTDDPPIQTKIMMVKMNLPKISISFTKMRIDR